MRSASSEPKRRYIRFLAAAYVASLVFVPMDFGTAILWLGGFAAAFWSVVQLLICGIQLWAKDQVHWPTAVGAPLLTMTCLVVAMWAGQYSFRKAERFCVRAAAEIQHQCRGPKGCPTSLKGWQTRSLCAASTRVGYFTTFHVCYQPSEDRLTFNLQLRQNIDSGTLWTGGQNVRLQRSDRVD